MKSDRKGVSGKKPVLLKPDLKWQTGDYERLAAYDFVLTYQFLLLCKLSDITPRRLLIDFLENLDCGSSNREGRDKAKDHLINYFIEMGYGRHLYSSEEIRNIFSEMNAIGMLFPSESKMKLMDLHVHWRNKYHRYWFKKWFKKIRRKI
jgi:hypothetical protein